MKRYFIPLFALFGVLNSNAQNEVAQDSAAYKLQKLKIEEINLISSFYKQDGNNSAVTGGIGSEKLTDISNSLDVMLVKYGRTGKKHTFDFELGIDHYSSASSDRIDLNANSSASYSDTRIYPSLRYTRENEQRGNSFMAGISSSSEFDYQSYGATLGFSKKTKDKNGEFSARIQTYFDQVKMINPVELRPVIGNGGTEARNTFAGSLSYSQIINKNFQVLFQTDIVSQNGYLGLPFHRVYFSDGTVHQESLPDSRLKIPLAIRGSYFLGDNIIIRGYYRYYTDDWKLTSHTADIEVPIKITPFFSVSPFYRYYTQSGVKYFKGYKEHTGSEQYYTSNYDLSEFNSHFVGMGIRLAPPKGVFGIKNFNSLEVRYAHYSRSNNLSANMISIHLKYK